MPIVQCAKGCVDALAWYVLGCQSTTQLTVEAGATVAKPSTAAALPADQLAYSVCEAHGQGLHLQDLLQRLRNAVRWGGGGHNGEVHENCEQPHCGSDRSVEGQASSLVTRVPTALLRSPVRSEVLECFHGERCEWRNGVAPGATHTTAPGPTRKGGKSAAALAVAAEELVHASVRPQAQAQCVEGQCQLPKAHGDLRRHWRLLLGARRASQA
mmetsp:Transcript_63904/g.177274  ORF Transcript_63904/g.177274 Transcript_63904/m.177274 type:complete len:213 (-) Transcript_63904:830-1468(-)